MSKFTWWLGAHVCHLSFQGQDSSMRNKDKYYPKEGTSLKSIATLLRPLVEAAGGGGGQA